MAPFEIVLNLKAYHEATLEKAQYLASELHSFLQGYTGENITLSLAPNIIDLQLLHYNFPTLRLIAPHVDAIKEGKQTGWVPASVFRRLGIETTILNHTEHRLSFSEMLDIIHRLKEVSMNVIVCCQSIEEAQELQKAEPYAIAFELPALIGSGKSIMHEELLVREFVSLKQGKTRMYVGAGIGDHTDIASARALGIEGVLLATAFVFSDNPQRFLRELTNE